MKKNIESQYVLKGFSLLASHYGSMFFSIFFTFWLARLLDPADFGRLVIGVFSLDIFNALTDWGWDQAILHEHEAQAEVVYATHLKIRFFLGLIPLLVVAATGYVKNISFFSDVHGIALLLALAFLFEKISLTYKTILEREYRLCQLAGLEIVSLVLSFVLALVSVKNGFGVSALVVQRLSEKIFLCAGYVYASSWRFSREFDFLLLKKWIHSFGIATACSGLVSLFLYDFMGAFIGVSHGTHQGGLYARSFKMATLPLIFTTVCGRLATPLYATNVGNLEQLKKIFLLAQMTKFLVILPIQAFLAFLAPVWMIIVLGESWRQAVPLYQLLCLYGALRAFYDDVPSLFLYGLRQPWIMFQQHLVQGGALFFATVVLCNFLTGAFCGAVVMTIGMFVGVVVLWIRTFFALHISWNDCTDAIATIYRYTLNFGRRLVGSRSE
ncbi:hypothetical protein FJ366_02435 [Candidatus Dependentiae bacterium]|nr:hypothetical protein [Candidatus Dependentiae bacterium]